MRQVAHISEVDYLSFYSILSCLTPPLSYISFLNLPVPIVLPFLVERGTVRVKSVVFKNHYTLGQILKEELSIWSPVFCLQGVFFTPPHPPPFPLIKTLC